jgi:hypothetical protein
MTVDASTPINTKTNQFRTGETAMNELHTHLARAQLAERLEEARELGRGRRILAARRLSRRAERAAHQARLALARSL